MLVIFDVLVILDFNVNVLVIFDVLVVLDFNVNVLVIFDVHVVLDFNVIVLVIFDVLVVLVLEWCPQKAAMIQLLIGMYSFFKSWLGGPKRQNFRQNKSSSRHITGTLLFY